MNDTQEGLVTADNQYEREASAAEFVSTFMGL